MSLCPRPPPPCPSEDGDEKCVLKQGTRTPLRTANREKNSVDGGVEQFEWGKENNSFREQAVIEVLKHSRAI
jgi:hypothetical protein